MESPSGTMEFWAGNPPAHLPWPAPNLGPLDPCQHGVGLVMKRRASNTMGLFFRGVPMFETTNGPGSLQRHGGAALGGLFAGRGGRQCTHWHRGDQFGAPVARRHGGPSRRVGGVWALCQDGGIFLRRFLWRNMRFSHVSKFLNHGIG